MYGEGTTKKGTDVVDPFEEGKSIELLRCVDDPTESASGRDERKATVVDLFAHGPGDEVAATFEGGLTRSTVLIEPGDLFAHERLRVLADGPQDDEAVSLPLFHQIDRMIFHPQTGSEDKRIQSIQRTQKQILQQFDHVELLFERGSEP